MSRHEYGQYCPVAAALDVVGERWTLLLVRELLLGPRRFGDLLASLPGLGTSLLAARLKSLESAGVIAKERLGPPANTHAYRLTERGAGLGPVVAGLADWGRGELADRAPDDGLRPELLGLVLAATWPRPPVKLCVEVQVDGVAAFHLRLDPARTGQIRQGRPDERPDAVLRTGVRGLTAMAVAGTSLGELEERTELVIDAPPSTAAILRTLFPSPKENPS